MSGAALAIDLAWLQRAPSDFRARARALATDPSADGNAVRRLATYALDTNGLLQLANAIAKLRAAGNPLRGLAPFKLGLAGNSTLELFGPALVASAARHGVALELIVADYAQTIQEATSPHSKLNTAKPDAVLLALDFRGLPLRQGRYDDASAEAIVADALEYVDTVRAGFRAHAGAFSIVQTLAQPPQPLFGNYDRAVPGSIRALIARFNDALVSHVRESGDVVLDVASLAETIGTATWHSPTQWNIAKLAMDSSLIPLYADHVGRVLGALRGRSRKCLVLDLDNTLWGGVIGDDGIEGIVLGQGDPTGEAYLEVQQTALALRERGVVLAVSSKNDDGVARAPFSRHPEMLLEEHHIAVFQANWNDKATNVAAIATELNLGLDALVFLDDNPVERNLVREMLPEVAVPELPDDPALYARTLLAAGYFEAIGFSDEDRKRAEYYHDNARRVALQGAIGDLEGYLRSLDMEIRFSPFDATGRSRIAQLINKSNQFNLTTRRYSEIEVAELEADPSLFTLQVRLRDRFGDNGMIGVVVCKPHSAGAWEVDTWLMSCRVLGRRVEAMVLREIVHHARARGIERLVGVFLPTERNAMVADHYEKLGFTLIERDASGESRWEFSSTNEVEPAPMRVERAGFEAPERPQPFAK
jgi:FkbH-like protein